MERRKKVTPVHKTNSFLMTDGLFLECVDTVAKEFPEVEVEDIIVDAMTAHLVRHPERFDVIVTTNFYADILSDLASELSGSLGLADSILAESAWVRRGAETEEIMTHVCLPQLKAVWIAVPNFQWRRWLKLFKLKFPRRCSAAHTRP